MRSVSTYSERDRPPAPTGPKQTDSIPTRPRPVIGHLIRRHRSRNPPRNSCRAPRSSRWPPCPTRTHQTNQLRPQPRQPLRPRQPLSPLPRAALEWFLALQQLMASRWTSGRSSQRTRRRSTRRTGRLGRVRTDGHPPVPFSPEGGSRSTLTRRDDNDDLIATAPFEASILPMELFSP